MLRAIAGLSLAVALSGCAAESIWAPDEAVQAARYVHSGPTEIALVTSINDKTGGGAHSAIVINGSERVIFDPAGNWDGLGSPERNDVRFGFTPTREKHYLQYQSFQPYHAVVQRVTVAPGVAERALALAKANGAVPPAFCASATSGILRQLPGFESMPSTMYPDTLMEAFAAIPGVRTEVEFGSPDPADPQRQPRMSPVIVAAMQGRPGG
jgi:hypothetical protein